MLLPAAATCYDSRTEDLQDKMRYVCSGPRGRTSKKVYGCTTVISRQRLISGIYALIYDSTWEELYPRVRCLTSRESGSCSRAGIASVAMVGWWWHRRLEYSMSPCASSLERADCFLALSKHCIFVRHALCSLPEPVGLGSLLYIVA